MTGAGAPADGAEVPHVLLAHDEPSSRAHLVELLEAQGWRVTPVAEGDTALRAATAALPDLLLTCATLPGLDGAALLRAVREDPRTQTLPVVVLDAATDDLGADDHVAGSFPPEALVGRLRAAITMGRLRSRHVAEVQELARAAALVTSGRPLEEALGVLAEQVRVLLDARGVTVSVDDAEAGRPEVVREAGDTAAPAAGEEVVRTPVLGRRNRVLGTVAVVLSVASARRPETEPLLSAAARVLAAVVEEGRRSERDATTVATLQGFLLPERLPEVAGIELAAAYRPAERTVQVGGDWYDVLALADGRVALSVGDVAGHGLESALLMGQLRTAVRTYALSGMTPARTTAALDELIDRLPGPSMATFFIGYLEVATGELTWCSAGHPPPATTEPGGAAGWVDGPVAPPLGAMFGQEPSQSTATLPPDARLVLYTDGLVERRESQLDEGMPELLARLRDHATDSAEQMVSRVVGAPTVSNADDVAVVVVRLLPRPNG
ncbi:MAG TPA: SpoIIE family protein phosphatase [Nocardioides sp.]|nr:SpoIIE family protein phosphatase [Nocardioides sp.]